MQQPFIDKKIHVNIPLQLLNQLDRLAVHKCMSRSALIRVVLAEYVHQPMHERLLGAEPGRDVELEEFLKSYHESHPDG